VGYKYVQRFEGAFTGTRKEITIGILLARESFHHPQKIEQR